MNVLGLGTEGDSGAAVVKDGRLVSAINEERLSRLKLVVGFPRDSLREALRLAELDTASLDAVLVGGTRDLFVDELEPFDGWFQTKASGLGGLLKRTAGRFAGLRDELPFLESAYYASLSPTFAKRRRNLRRLLEREFGVTCPIEFVDHHSCHLTAAYYTSGFDDALVLSIDGGGDALSGLVYAVRDGKWERLHEVSAYDSLGNYYAYVTHLCGFKAMKHEGKITGLAAHGEPKYVGCLEEFVRFENGGFVNCGRVAHMGAIRALDKRLPKGWTREDLAASIQQHTENLTRSFVGWWVDRSGMENVALAGGVFANVRVNQEVHELPSVRRIFIHPHMGDGGLAAGAALAAGLGGVPPEGPRQQVEAIPHVYLGSTITDEDAKAALEDMGLEAEPLDEPLAAVVAKLLADGHVVARAAGGMEYGPRALGNRTIMYHPSDPDVNHWLNANLNRTEFMPFAPAVLAEERDRCFHDIEGAEHAAEFMTITFQCTEWMKNHMPGVVHIDGTARPQLVRSDRNPGFHEIIREFHERTGLPAIINTSFNMHEEPIVCTAKDAVRAFLDGNLDYLVLGSFLVRHPAGINHPLKSVEESLGSALPAG
ncbi:MAG: carbamoyltransferase [Gemmatimonadota bacterium]|nr:carbamoyltransferase [Gemmatimonadota bacterium]